MFAISNHTLKDFAVCLERRNRRVPPRTLVPPGSNSATAITPLPTLLTEPYVLMVGSMMSAKTMVAWSTSGGIC